MLIFSVFKKYSAIISIGIVLIILYGLWFSSNSPFFNVVVAGKYLYFNAFVVGKNMFTKTHSHMAFSGPDGDLFYGKDLREIIQPWLYTRNNIAVIAALNDTLCRKGIKLLVVPVPVKEAIIQTYSPFKANIVSNQRTRMIKMLRKRNIAVIDLMSPFIATNPKDGLFQKKDNHWGGQGLLIAARILADSVNRILGVERQSFYSYRDTIVYGSGDLALFLGDSSQYPWACRMIIGPGWKPFKDSVWSDIMIFGDSFSRINRAFGGGIGAQIAYYSNRQTFTIDHINAANAPSEIIKFLKNRRKAPKIIVWVFTSYHFLEKFE